MPAVLRVLGPAGCYTGAMATPSWSDEIPIKFGPASNGEYLVPPATAVQREAQRRTLAEAAT